MNRRAAELFALTTPSTLPPAPPVNGRALKTAGPPTPPPPKDPRPFKPGDDGEADGFASIADPVQRRINRAMTEAHRDAQAAAEPRPDFADDIDRLVAALVADGTLTLDPATGEYRPTRRRRWRLETEEERRWRLES